MAPARESAGKATTMWVVFVLERNSLGEEVASGYKHTGGGERESKIVASCDSFLCHISLQHIFRFDRLAPIS